ncbi:ribosomal protein S18 (chloroplast) [Guillardia theta]|uniref:Small ribosomal subunit protein bS18c n=2 Tax=Guillardia theta TaxID=55529 RepID=RR18_GUITH|nr:ribosomal protein S18 [Guillardia theta]O78488.1 RecName: Full=Small ribosomal subunit protein bS18c; AltName: Full=30S ribosomal protein S18, chloroplastic [Guillardia theta]AAC35679.1 ribosomal protein S18 [Guillardia theta]
MAIFRRKNSPIKKDDFIDYKDVELLSKFLTEQGKILPRRITGLTMKQQSRLTKAVKRARILSLLPFINRDMIL